MHIMVFSDSHGHLAAVREAVASQPNADMILFLGDGYYEVSRLAEEMPEQTIYMVRGNCDWVCSEPEERTVDVDGVRIWMLHGHTRGVKHGTEAAEAAARANGARILLFGHTHEPVNTYRDGLYIMNPGSLGYPNHGDPTYGVIDITPNGILTNIVQLSRGLSYGY